MSRRGICLIWFRGRHISPSMPYREARSVAESSEGPTASKSDRTGRNPGMTRLVRRSSAGCLEVLRFSLLFKHSVSACVNVLPFLYRKTQWKKDAFFLQATCWHFSWFYRHKGDVRTMRFWSSGDREETGAPKMLRCKHGGSRVNLSLWPFCGRIPGPTDTIHGGKFWKLKSSIHAVFCW